MEVDVLKRVPVREQDPKVRATNFEEVCYGYNKEEAMAEASRCLNCKNAQCMKGCPVSINIPAFVEQVKMVISQRLMRLFQSHQHFLLYVDVYAHRRASVRASVSEASRAILSQSESSRDLLLIQQERMASSQRQPQRKTAKRWLLSVQVLQDLHVPETLQSLAMM